MPFEPGNQAAKGRSNPREFADMLRVAVKEAQGDKPKLRWLAERLVDEGLQGNIPAIKEIADRLDGKVPQAVIGGDEDDPAIKIISAVEYHVVYPDGTRAPILDASRQIEDRDSAGIPAVTTKSAL